MYPHESYRGTQEDQQLVESDYVWVCSSKPGLANLLRQDSSGISGFAPIAHVMPYPICPDQYTALEAHAPSVSPSLLMMVSDERELHVPVEPPHTTLIDIQIWQTIAQALLKARMTVNDFFLAYEVGGKYADRMLFCRDTSQHIHIGSMFDNNLVGQSHPGPDIQDQMEQTKDMIDAPKIIIITVNALFAGRFPTQTPEDILHTLSAIRSGAFGYPIPNIPYIARAAISVVALRLRGITLSGLPKDLFTDKPGGLEFDRIHDHIECCVLNENVVLSRRAAYYADIYSQWFSKSAQWIPLLNLPQKHREAFIQTYKGIVSQRDRQWLLQEGHDFLKNIHNGGFLDQSVPFAVFR